MLCHTEGFVANGHHIMGTVRPSLSLVMCTCRARPDALDLNNMMVKPELKLELMSSNQMQFHLMHALSCIRANESIV